MHTLKPIDTERIDGVARTTRFLVTLEEHSLIGGLGSAVTDYLMDQAPEQMPFVKRMGIPDEFPNEYGSQDSMMETLGLQPPAIAETVRQFVRSQA